MFCFIGGAVVVVSGEAIYNAIFPTDVEDLSQDSYQAKDTVEVVVNNAGDKNIEVKIKNAENEEVDTVITERSDNRNKVFSLEPSTNIKPGAYSITVLNKETEEVLSKQDFTWGVLAINTNKSIYLKNEIAHVAIAVLDEEGEMDCDALVELRIINPDGGSQKLTTDNGTISINPECQLHEVTEKPDYEAFYAVGGVGRYSMELRAVTENGAYQITDRFEVREYVPFTVERQTATRIYPPEKYPVTLKITAHEDFQGKIIEPVPEDFQISAPSKSGVIGYSEVSTLFKPKDPIPDLSLPFNGNYEVGTAFGEPIDEHDMAAVYRQYGMDGHDGIDFIIPSGSLVTSVDNGKVILAKSDWLYGNTVVVEHSWGRSYYGHLDNIDVQEGQAVTAGNVIGKSGSSGVSSPQLHFGLKPNDSDFYNLYFGKIDPAPYLGIASSDPAATTAAYPHEAKALVWDISLESGQSIHIGYQFKSPPTSPNFYTIGPLQFISDTANTSNQDAPLDTPGSQYSGQSIVFSEIRPWQIAIDATTTTTFQFPSDAQSWTYTETSACGNATGAFTGAAGNAAGSLQILYSKSGGNVGPCNYYWEWSGTWQSLSVPSTDTVTGISGSYEYQVPTNTTAGTWSTGAFELRDSGGTQRLDIVSALTGQTGTVASFTNRSGSTQTFAGEPSSTSIRLRLNSGFSSSGGGSRALTFRFDNISVTVTHQSGPTMDQVLRHGNWFSSGVEQSFTF